MKRTIEEHAQRFDERAETYDGSKSPEYQACRDRVIELAAASTDDTVLDLGAGTGAVALALAPEAERVVARDISEGMLEVASHKAEDRGIDNLSVGVGRFLEPNYDGEADIITTNFALHHLDVDRKRASIASLTETFRPDRFVLGDVMFFGAPDPNEPFYDPEVDDPATVGRLVAAFTDAGYAVTHVEAVHEQVGVIAAEPR